MANRELPKRKRSSPPPLPPPPPPSPQEQLNDRDEDGPPPWACLLVVGAPGVGKSTRLWQLHRAHAPADASVRLAALLDAVSARTCRETLLAFCRGPAPRSCAAAAVAAQLRGYDRQVVLDDVDALPRGVQSMLAAIVDRFRPLPPSPASSPHVDAARGRCRFVFSCTSLSKVQPALLTRLRELRLAPPDPAQLEAAAAAAAVRRGLRFAPAMWRDFCTQHCRLGDSLRAAQTALHRLALLKDGECTAEEVRAEWLGDDQLEPALDALLADAADECAEAPRAQAAAAYLRLRGDLGLAPADLLDALQRRVQTRRSLGNGGGGDGGGDGGDAWPPERRFRWLEVIGRAVRGLAPPLDGPVPWVAVFLAAEVSLM